MSTNGRATQGASCTLKSAYALSVSLALLLVFAIAWTLPCVSYAQTSVVGQSASTNATTEGARKSFFDSSSHTHWVFWYNGTAVEYSSSPDGATWTSRGTLAYNTPNFSVAQKVINGTSYIFFATEANTYDVVLRRGTISGTSVSFDSEVTVLDGTSANDTYIRPHVVLDSNGKVWTAAFKDLGKVGDRYSLTTRCTANRGDQALSFNPATSMGKPSVSVTNVGMVPTTGDKMLAAVSGESATNVVAYEFNGSAWVNADVGGEDGSLRFASTNVVGEVRAIAIDARGNIYVGGVFTIAGGVTVNRIAKWDGSSWSALGTGMNGTVHALAVDPSGNLYAGGSFTTAGGVTVNRVAKWNGTSWSSLGGGVTNAVYALAVDTNGNLYAGGAFTTVDGLTVNRIAKWNGTSWSALGTGANSTVFALDLDASGNVHVGGSFTMVGSSPANRIAKWDGSSWTAVGTGFNSTVRALKFDAAGNLYAGGDFTTAGAVTVNNIAMWNGSSWSSLGTGVGSTVRALAVDGSGNVYVGGDFYIYSPMAFGGARWNGVSWSGLGSSNLGLPNDIIYAIALDDAGRVYAGRWKEFRRLNGSSWERLSPGFNDGVSKLTSDSDGNLYAIGHFEVSGGAADKLAKWNGTSWSALGVGLSGDVYDFTVAPGGTLYATIESHDGVYLSAWNGSSWSSVGTDFQVGYYALTTDSGGTLYKGGYFTTAGGVTVSGIAKWDGSSWTPLGTGFDGDVVALTTDLHGTLYAGGDFTTVDGVAVSGVAKWNGTSWSKIGDGLEAVVSVSDLATDSSGNLYVGGLFRLSDGNTVSYVAKWNGASWSSLGYMDFGEPRIRDLAVDAADNVYAVGEFSNAGGVAVNRIAKWNGTSWSPVSSPIAIGSNSVSTVTADSNGNVYVGGTYGVSLIRPVAVTNQLAGSTASLIAGANGDSHLTYIDSNNDLMMKIYSGNGGGWSAATTLFTGMVTSQATGFYESNASLVSWFIEGGTVKYTEASSPYTVWTAATSINSTGSPANVSVYGSSVTHSQIVAIWNQGGEVVSSLSGIAPSPTPTHTPTSTPTQTPTPTPTPTPTLPPPPPPDVELGNPGDIGSGPIIVTRGRRIVVSGTGAAGFSVEIRVDGLLVGTVPIAAASGGDGSATRPWSYTLPDLAPGERELTTTYVKTEDVRSPPSRPVKIIVLATAPLDFMGMGDTAITTWRRAGGAVRFKIRRASGEVWITRTVRGRYPAAADYDNDGVSDVAAVGVRKGSFEWNVKLSMTGEAVRTTVGETGDTIISGCSFTANKGASLAVFKGKERQLRHLNVGDSQPRTVTLNGLGSGNVIGCGDTDGDGVDELLYTTRGADNRIRVVGYDMTGQRRFESKYNSFVRGFVVDRPNSAVPLVAVIGGTERRGRQVKITTMAGSFAFPRFFVERGATIGNGTFTTENNQQVSGIFWANRKTRMVSRRLLSKGATTTELFTLPKGYSLVRPQGIMRTEGGK